MNNRKHARRIMNSLCVANYGVHLDDLPDLPCIMYAIDEMEEILDDQGENASLSELQDIAQEALAELAEEEGFEL